MKPSILILLCLAAPAFADDTVCQEVRDASYDACYRPIDTRRADCFGHCERCREQVSACRDHCEHYCDAPYYEGCAFDLNGCTTRCEHRCHERVCETNPGCRAHWCGADNIKVCVDECQSAYRALAGCRGLWCGDGKAKKQCLDGCAASEKTAVACRKTWCGDGAAARQCYREADEAEQQCRKQVDADYKACVTAAGKAEPAKR